MFGIHFDILSYKYSKYAKIAGTSGEKKKKKSQHICRQNGSAMIGFCRRLIGPEHGSLILFLRLTGDVTRGVTRS